MMERTLALCCVIAAVGGSGAVRADATPAKSCTDEVCAHEPSASETRAVGIRVAAGFGGGTRGYRLPAGAGRGILRLPDSPFLAVDLQVGLHALRERPIGVDVLISYQSSIGWVLEQQPLFGLPQELAVRSQHLELSVRPVLRLGRGGGDLSLALPVGFTMRSFWPRSERFAARDYYLGGPVLRVELRVRLGRSAEVLLGPELQWLPLGSEWLQRRGVDLSSTYALGAQGSLQFEFGPVLRTALAYRESHASLAHPQLPLADVERYFSLGLAGEW